MQNIDLIYSCFNQFVFQEAKNHIKELLHYVNTSPVLCGNQLALELTKAIQNYDFEMIDVPLFQSIISRCGKTEAEGNMILNKIAQYKRYTKDQTAPARKDIQDISANLALSRAYKQYKDSPSELIKYIKNLDIKTTDTEDLNTVQLNQVDINSIIAKEANNVIPSKFDFINDSFSSGGYEKGEMILICMPPGQGKSLFMLEEIMWMAIHGKKCHILTMGDLNMSDQILRMSAIYSGLPFKEAKRNLLSIYKDMCKVMGNNLSFTIVPAGVTDVDKYIEFIEGMPGLEVLGIDYDSNFQSAGNEDSMYDAYGKIYQKLTKLTDDEHNKLVFVACQPKVGVWNNPVLGLPDVGESSRKQHSADCIITRGRDTASPNHLGAMNIAKNRRGETDVVTYSIRLNNGRTRILPREVYKNIRQIEEKRNFTDKDIDDMISAWSINQAKMNGAVRNNINSIAPTPTKTVNKGPNPFMH